MESNILISLFVGIVIVNAFLFMLGSLKRSKVEKKINLDRKWDNEVNSLLAEEKSLLNDYESLNDEQDIHNKKVYDCLSRIKTESSNHESAKVELRFMESLWNNYFMHDKRLENHMNYQTKAKYLKSVYSKVNSSLITRTENKQSKHSHYKLTDSKYQELCVMSDKWDDIKSCYLNVMNEISEARNAIDDAETMETLDMFTDNKGLSVLSTISTSDANSEIRDVKPALKTLESKLEDVKVKEDLINVDDSFDLMVDLFFDFSFDFTSLFNLFSLSSADSKLSSLERELQPLGAQIQEKVEKATSAKESYLASLD